MARKKQSDFDSIVEFLFYAGVGYLVYKWLFSKDITDDTQIDLPGIHGPQYRRILEIKNIKGVELIVKDLQKYDPREQTEIIRLIRAGRLAPELKRPLYKIFKNSIISGELRSDKWRVFLKRIDAETFVAVSVFRKQGEETPESETTLAENRITEYEKYRLRGGE